MFHKLATEDPTIRIFKATRNKLIWEAAGHLAEEEEFIQDLQSFRRGNAKATIYCSVESRYTINRLKYTESCKQFIFNRNIWIKPDLYATQIVSCPGIFTLAHPKLTNKTEFVKQLSKTLQYRIYWGQVSRVPKLVTHQQTDGMGYRLLMVEKTTSRVGTYTEVLSRRFTSQTNTQHLEESRKNLPHMTAAISRVPNPIITTDPKVSVATNRLTNDKLQHSVTSNMVGITNSNTQASSSSGIGKDTHHNWTLDQHDSTLVKGTQKNQQMETPKNNFTQDIQKRLQKLENGFQQRIKMIKEKSEKTIYEMENRMEQKLNNLLDSKLIKLSTIVADTVTNRLLKAMQTSMTARPTTRDSVQVTTEHTITQESPQKETSSSLTGKHPPEDTMVSQNIINRNTTAMVTELQNIEQQQKYNDSLHDTTTLESVPVIK